MNKAERISPFTIGRKIHPWTLMSAQYADWDKIRSPQRPRFLRFSCFERHIPGRKFKSADVGSFFGSAESVHWSKCRINRSGIQCFRSFASGVERSGSKYCRNSRIISQRWRVHGDTGSFNLQRYGWRYYLLYIRREYTHGTIRKIYESHKYQPILGYKGKGVQERHDI